MPTEQKWERVYGPDDYYDCCGDDSLYEIGSVYQSGDLHIEMIYYVTQTDDGLFGTSQVTHSYRQTPEQYLTGDSDDEEYEYDIAGFLYHDTFDAAKKEAVEYASQDESEYFHWEEKKDTPEDLYDFLGILHIGVDN